jgi:hypothetical protein
MIGSRGGTTSGAKLETVIFFLVFLLGIAAGYIWRDQISRARHDRARAEQRKERMQAGLRDLNGTYRPQSSSED